MGTHLIEKGQGGLDRLAIACPWAEAHLYFQGAHVTHYQPAGSQPVLWLSPRSHFEAGQPIRGGVPVCFPWFGPKADEPQAPLHGLVRTMKWDLLSVDTLDNGSVRASLCVDCGPWMLTHTLTLGTSLTMKLEAYNRSGAAATFESALHTYLAVGDVGDVEIEGLAGCEFLDKADAMARKTQREQPLRLSAQTDRVYLNTPSDVEVRDVRLGRVIRVEKQNAASTIVWNPWDEKARAMPEIGADAWRGFVCVESGNVMENRVAVNPGRSHAMTVRITAS